MQELICIAEDSRLKIRTNRYTGCTLSPGTPGPVTGSSKRIRFFGCDALCGSGTFSSHADRITVDSVTLDAFASEYLTREPDHHRRSGKIGVSVERVFEISVQYQIDVSGFTLPCINFLGM